MQEFCRSICLKSGISETSPKPLRINAQFPYNTLLRMLPRILVRTSSNGWPEVLARGQIENRGGSETVNRPISAELRPGVETIGYEPLRASIRSILDDELPQAHEVSRVLEHMAKISSTADTSVPVIDYEKDERKLHITDPFFAFFLRWGREIIDA
jgi:hypothetical protein